MSFDQFVLASGEVGGQTTGISFVLCVFLMAHGWEWRRARPWDYRVVLVRFETSHPVSRMTKCRFCAFVRQMSVCLMVFRLITI